MNLRTAFFPVALLSLVTAAWAADVKKIAAKDAAKLVAEGTAVLVDVREAPEWKDSGVAAPAALLPMSDYYGAKKLWTPFLEKNAGKEIILYCRSGSRSDQVAADLVAKGVKAVNVGTLRAWTSAGLPTRAAEAPAATK